MQNAISQEPDFDWFNPFDSSYIHDPYPAIERIHATSPAFHYKPLDLWVLSKYDDVKSVLKDSDTFSSKVFGFLPPPADIADQLSDFTDHELLLGMDRPEHPALRQPLASVFTHKLVSDLEPCIRERASALIDGFSADGSCELMSQYSYPLALATIIQVFGVPAEHAPLFRKWSDDFMTMLTVQRSPEQDQETAHPMPADEIREHWVSLLDAKDYFKEYVSTLRSEPGTDIFSALLALKDAQGKPQVSDATAVVNIPNLIAAGHDTTANMISQTLILLDEHPDQRELLIENPELLPQAIEEALRVRGSALGLLRRATKDIEIGGLAIPAGSITYALLNGAGMDADRFEDPGKFDITRTNAGQHLAFGFGRHNCIGSQVARMQARVAVGEFLKRMPHYTIDRSKPITYAPGLPLRFTTHVAVKW